MSKKEIIILSVVFVGILLITSLSVYFIFNKDKTNDNSNSNTSNVESNKVDSDTIKVGEYTLKLGEYVGTYEDYDYDKQQTTMKSVRVVLTKDTINNQTYIIKGNSLYVNNIEMYKVSANNKIAVLAGGGVEVEYVREK